LRLALDTSAYSALMRGHRDVVALVRRADAILLPAIVAGELFYGFRRGSRLEENSARLEAFLATTSVELLPVSLTTADRFGRISATLRRKGTPIPTNDVWIAAQAMESGADLLSADTHFEQVDGLAWLPFEPAEEGGVRERTWRYHTGSEGGRETP
jgi:tRNA(fMet)-specific endonuclease VapC